MSDAHEIARGLSAHARFSIDGGTDAEWYALTDRVADEIEALGIVRRPFPHDPRILVPNARGIAVRQALTDAQDKGEDRER